MTSRLLVCFTLGAFAALSPACGDSGDASTGSGGGGGGGPTCDADKTGCTVTVAPSSDDTTTLQTALIEASSGDTVCLCPGTYSLLNRLSLAVPEVTVRGIGASREDVVLDFAGQMAGDDGFTVTSDGFTVEKLSVKNTPGNGIVVTGADRVTFRNILVSWDAGSVTENGAYAIYPVKCSKVLVEDSEIIGAADAGVYVGQSTEAIVRNNLVHGNVAGIEIENTTTSEVYGNQAYDNAAGILVFNLPNLEKKDGGFSNIHDNEVFENNRENFAESGTIVAAVPHGIGILLLAADDTEIHDNDVHDNQSVSIIVTSYTTLQVLVPGGTPDPMTDPDPERTYIYGNTFTNNGTDPISPIDALPARPVEDVVWDGVEKTAGSGELCLSMTPPTFRNFNGLANIGVPANHSTDTTPHECDATKQTPLSF